MPSEAALDRVPTPESAAIATVESAVTGSEVQFSTPSADDAGEASHSAPVDTKLDIGDLIVQGGETRTINENIFVGSLFTPGQLVIRDPGSRVVANGLFMGTSLVSGSRVDILNGGTLETSSPSRIGLFPGTGYNVGLTGLVLVDGAGSHWNATGGVEITRAGEVVLTNGGRLTAPFVTISGEAGPHASGVGMLTIGGRRGSNPVAPGFLNVSSITGGELNLNHTHSDYVLDVPMNGVGLNVYAGTTRLTGSQQSWSAHLRGGRLLFEGAFRASALVEAGAFFGGAGTLTDSRADSWAINVLAGGTLTPGSTDPIGTIRVAGNVIFRSGALYAVDATANGRSDLLDVAGLVRIEGGWVVVSAQGSPFAPFTEYEILRASGGVEGRFEGANVDYAFLTGILGYTPQSVTLRLVRNDIDFSDVAATANQRSVANAVEALGNGNRLWQSVLTADATSARRKFDLLSGEIHASNLAAMTETAFRMKQTAARASKGALREAGPHFWVTGMGGRTDFEAGAGIVGLDSRYDALLVGGDIVFGDWALGGTLGAGGMRSAIDKLASSAEGEHRHIGASFGRQWGPIRLDLGATLSAYDLRSRRIPDIGVPSGPLVADYEGRVAHYHAEFAHRKEWGRWRLEPFLGAGMLRSEIEPFREIGGPAALSVERAKADAAYGALGLRAAADFGRNDRWRFEGGIDWRHSGGKGTSTSHQRFVAGDGSRFAIRGAEVDGDTTSADAGLVMRLAEGLEASMRYNGQFRSGADDHAVAVALRLGL